MCPRRRSLVFSSPQRLKLQLSCTPETPARVTLEVWPVLPLLVQGHIPETSDADDIVAVLEHQHRMCKIDLNVPSSQFGKILTAMREPFPKLTNLSLWSYDETAPALSDSFLGDLPPKSAIPLVGRHPGPISGITEATILLHSRQSSSSYNSSLRLYISRSDGQLPLRVDQPRITST